MVQCYLLTASDKAWSWRACNFLLTSRNLALYQPLKFVDLKKRRYKPTQSPLIIEVSWGPEVANVARKSSWLKGLGVGAAWKQIIEKLINITLFIYI